MICTFAGGMCLAASIEDEEQVGGFGTGWRNPAGLPASRFLSQLERLPQNIQTQVLERVALLAIPEMDFEALRIHPRGDLFYVCNMGGMPSAARPVSATESTVFSNAVPIAAPPLFHSRPGSTSVLFLDFNGHVVSNTYWNTDSDYGPTASWDCRPYGHDADETTFSPSEQEAIQTIWQRVAEDYAPFDIDVTTEQPAVWNNHTGHVLITPDTDRNGVECPHFNAGGVAYVDVFGETDYSYNAAGLCYSPAWVLNYETAGDAQYEAEAASHEIGHNLALSHDGTKNTAYYGGHENGSIGWGPIMGTGYNRDVSQWSKGDYRFSNNTQDDLAIIAARIGYRPDDFANDLFSSSWLPPGPGGSIFQSGVVETTDDHDVFRFNAASGLVEIAVSPYRDPSSTTWGGNLDAVLELYDAAGVLLATNNPQLETTAALSVLVGDGQYFLKIRSTGVGDPLAKRSQTGYVRYGSIGQYTITGSIVVDPDLDDDGLPDVWEMRYFSNPTNAVSGYDADDDGLDNLSEYIAGTIPTNAASVLALNAITPSNGTISISWDSASNRNYTVWRSANLLSSDWNLVTNGIPAVIPINRLLLDNETNSAAFYRLDVRIDP